MPSRFLSKAERKRLSRFPSEVSDNDCIVYFTLTPADLAAEPLAGSLLAIEGAGQGLPEHRFDI